MEVKKRSLLAPFLEGPRPWLALARNSIPVLGVWHWGWTREQVFLQLWFEGAVSLGAMLAFQVRVFAARDEKLMEGFPWKGDPEAWRGELTAALWLIFWGIFGIPYWFAMLVFASFAGGPAGVLAAGSSIIVALLAVLAANVAEEWGRGYGRMTNDEIRLEFDWVFHAHLARVIVLIMAAMFLRLGVLAPLLLALTFIEIYPMRALRFFGGADSLDRANRERSED